MRRLSARRVVSISFAPGPHPTLLSNGGYKTRREKAMTYSAGRARAGVALAGAAVAGAGRHDEYRFGR